MRILSKESSFRGVHTALITPFLPDGSVDWKAFDTLLDQQLHGGVHGVVPSGTTGEAPTLTGDEKKALVEACVRKCKGRALVIAGTGSNDTRTTIYDSLTAAKAGADAVLVVTPYYNKPSQAGLEAHFRAVADESPIPVILYNVPTRTGVSLAPATVARLSEHPRIRAIKEASGSLALLTEMRAAVRERGGKPFYYLSGDDVSFWPSMASGSDGIISVASNLLPRCMRMLFEDWNEGRIGSGLALHELLSPLLQGLFLESNPVPVKTLMNHAKVRLPLAALQPETAEKLRRIWESLPEHLRKDHPREDIHG